MTLRQRLLVTLGSVAIVTLAGGELFARYALGLGTPPLSIADSEIEYLFKPNQDVYRFGNHVVINAYGMRSPDFPTDKPAGEFRLLVIGDSVVNGGSLTDQKDLATSIVADDLKRTVGEPVVVANISAGSWGPGNQLAYLRRYGTFGANAAILVLSSHDASDEPTFEALDPSTHPTQTPASALLEGMERYLPRYVPVLKRLEADPPPAPARGEFDSEQSLRKLFALFKSANVPMCLLQHVTQHELAKGHDAGFGHIRDVATSKNVPTIDMGRLYEKAGVPTASLYRDDIHLSSEGQKVLATEIESLLASNACRVPG